MRKRAAKSEQLRATRELLDLANCASLEEIKLAYRNTAKAHTPTWARIPLEPTDAPLDDEEWWWWWMKRFGNDPLSGNSQS